MKILRKFPSLIGALLGVGLADLMRSLHASMVLFVVTWAGFVGWGLALYLLTRLYDTPAVKYKKEPPSHGWKGQKVIAAPPPTLRGRPEPPPPAVWRPR